MFWGWSLGLEEQFHLDPLLFILLRKLRDDRARIAVLGALMMSALTIRLRHLLAPPAVEQGQPLRRALLQHPTRFDPLVAGILLAVIHRRYGKDIARWLEAPFHRALLALPALGCLWLLLMPGMFGPDQVP